MRDKFWAKVLAISTAVMMVVSCVTPCIAIEDLGDYALNRSDETLLRKAFTEKSFSGMPFYHPRVNEERDFQPFSDSDVSLPPNIIYVPKYCAKNIVVWTNASINTKKEKIL